MMRSCWCKEFSTDAEAVEVGMQWKSAETVGNPVSWGRWETSTGHMLQVCVKHGSKFAESLEGDGFLPCDPPPEH